MTTFMKNIITALLLLCCLSAKTQGIKFDANSSLGELKTEAQKNNKYILVDAFTTWCVPCKELDVQTFSDKKVGDYINDHFLSAKFQMDRTRNDSELIKSRYSDVNAIEASYGITAYPTVLILNPSGMLAGKVLGFKKPDEFISEIKSVIDRFKSFEQRYNEFLNGRRDSVFVFKLASEIKGIGNSGLAHEIAQTYIGGLSESELFIPNNLDFLYNYTERSTDRGFNIFREQSKRADEVFGKGFKQPSRKKLQSIIYREEIEPFSRTNAPEWSKILSNVKNKYGALDPEFYYGIRLGHAMEHENWDELGKFYPLYYRTAYDHSVYHINNASYLVFQHIKDPKVLKVAAKTMKYSIDHFDQGNFGAYDTYAGLLYKLGNLKEAIQWQEKAVKGAPHEEAIVANLAKMKRGERTW